MSTSAGNQHQRAAGTQEKDVRKHALEVAAELGALEETHAAKYLTQAPLALAVHEEVEHCLQLVDTMEETLQGFQTNLAEVSREIMHVQQSSSTMTLHIQNRKAAQQALDKSLLKLVVPPTLISVIMQNAIDDLYMDNLAVLHAKLQHARRLEADGTKLSSDLTGCLERLRLAATARVRVFLLEKIRSLRVPNTNVQIIQQAVLLRHQPAFRFLRKWHTEAASEVLQEYVNAMTIYYLDNFEQYSRGLWKLMTAAIEKGELTLAGEMAKSGVFANYRPSSQSSAFRITDRAASLASTENEVILTHVAEDMAQTFPLERIIRSVNAALRDNACAEYVFILQFFIHRSEVEGAEIFARVFQPTIKAMLADLRHAVDNTYDLLGLLMSVRVLEQAGIEMERRQMPILESYLQEAIMIIWPKYQLLVDRIVRNTRELPWKKLSAGLDVKPHGMTRRFAELSAAILEFSLGPNDGVVQSSILKLRSEFGMLFTKLAASFRVPIDQHAFAINNLATITTTLERTVKEDEPLLLHYQEQLHEQANSLIEKLLDQHFSRLTLLARAVEQNASSSQHQRPSFTKQQIAEISREFNESWAAEVEALQVAVQQRIVDQRTQVELMQAALARLMTYYTHFYLILEQELDINDLGWTPLGVQTLMVEVKKFVAHER
ncbi:Sac2 family-domain-containing protein [Thamnocephalis sphaerospora]|uniref:Sac2 family-domain-containing protein n=1 Tax=Thamnocephalis sphaerospora TaxID=78915 RepID=A0A4P9XX66_9FUNG|nr:Sac2 family-domain-containing protein [Thamnocephalis sphaerospora]|eukprot:RKP10887.1 Sac2 family-domain-containing protein [Thamnocephalis sphaerospora]